MTAKRWHQVEELFHQAAAMPPTERDGWLDNQCPGDAELARQVRQMLDADGSGGGTLERQIGDSISEWLSVPSPDQPARVGPWRIIKPIGAGGMGAVYLAARDDDSYRQLAAVKILRPEQLAPGMRERFRQERQILAELDHPNIARLLDGGATPDGRPYFVIEYVDGFPLTHHAASLPLRERCALFVTVCDAVAYAHRNLIVHRDLKPANILVDTRGNAKLLDFGIAKLIGVDHSMTSSMHAMFTPDYASPEQILGQPVTTATDVYALGAVLFELLAGQPVRSGANKSFAELVHSVTGGAGIAPSRVAKESIPADLDRIVEKAMAVEPERRYGSADQLAADLRRFLTGRAVEARGNSVFYSASKFARRNWFPLAALTLLVTGLAASTAWSLEQAQLAAQARVQAEHERDRTVVERARAELALAESQRQKTLAEKNAVEAATQRASALDRFHRSRKLTHKFLFEIEDALKDTVGATKARHVLVSTALEHFQQMGREIDNDPALIRDLSLAYEHIAGLQGYTGGANLGDFAGAVYSYQQSIEWRRKLGADPVNRLFLGDTITKQAKTLKWMGRIDEAERAFGEADRIFSPLASRLPADKQVLLVIYKSNLYRAWGEHFQVLDQQAQARDLLTRSVAELRRATALSPNDVSLRRALSSDCVTLSRSHMFLRDWPEALRTAELGLSVMRELAGANPPIREQSRLIPPGLQLVEVLHKAPVPILDIPRALALDEEMVRIGEKLVALDPANGRNQFLLSNVLACYGEHLHAAWRWPEANAAFDRALKIAADLFKASPANGYYQDMLGTGLILQGQLLYDMHDDESASRQLRHGVELLTKSVSAGRQFNKPVLHVANERLAVLTAQQ